MNAFNGVKVFAKLNSTATCANPQSVNSDTVTINCITTAIPVVDYREYFEVLPNPSKGLFTIAFRTVQRTTFEVIDHSGRTIYSAVSPMPGAGNTKEIDLRGKAAGVYYLRAKTGNKVVVTKLVVVK